MATSKEKIRIRATAIRAADQLSKIAVNGFGRPASAEYFNGESERRHQHDYYVPKISDFPEIDMDPMLADEDDWFVLPDDGKAPAVWPISTAICMPTDGGTIITYAKSITSKEARLQGAMSYSQFMVHGCSITLDKYNNVTHWGSGIFARLNRVWTRTNINILYRSHGEITPDPRTRKTEIGPSVIIGCALRHRYEWSALFHFPFVTLRFGCSARGALDLFRDRDKLDSEARRAALLHWVRKHWRRTASIKEMREVRKHLRGRADILWYGINVTIIPSEFELDQISHGLNP